MRDHQTFNPLGEFFRHLTPPAGTAGLPGPWAAYEYALDAWQRSVLLLDVLRQRANRPGNHQAETAAAQNSDAEAVVGQEAARLLAALQRWSEVDTEHYEQHVRPLLEKALTPVFAHLLVERQLPRLDDAVFSDRNPLMQGVAQLAATVRAERHPAGSDNPYLLLQQQLSSLLADALHTYADLRDQAVEQVFLTLRALPESSQLPDFVQGTQPAEAKFKASVPAAQADASAKATAKPAVARAAKPSRSQSASQQASLPGVAERPAGAIPAAVSSATAQPAVAAVPAAALPSPVVAPTVSAPAVVASPVTAKATDAATPPAAPRPVARPAPSAQVRPDAKPVTPAASTPKPAVTKAVAAPGSKTAAATPAAAMAATIAALATPVEKTVPARASASTRTKKPAAKPAAAKSGTAAKPVPPATPRKR